MRTRTIGLMAVLWGAVPAVGQAAPPDLDVRRDVSPVYAGFNDRLLTGPSSAAPEAIAFDYAREHLGIAASDLAALKLVARAVSPDGVTHLRYNQVVDGIESYDSSTGGRRRSPRARSPRCAGSRPTTGRGWPGTSSPTARRATPSRSSSTRRPAIRSCAKA